MPEAQFQDFGRGKCIAVNIPNNGDLEVRENFGRNIFYVKKTSSGFPCTTTTTTRPAVTTAKRAPTTSGASNRNTAMALMLAIGVTTLKLEM